MADVANDIVGKQSGVKIPGRWDWLDWIWIVLALALYWWCMFAEHSPTQPAANPPTTIGHTGPGERVPLVGEIGGPGPGRPGDPIPEARK